MTSTKELSVPIALVLASRTDTVSRVLAAICEARPRLLYVISDEGRTEKERAGFQAAKDLVASITWCDVRTLYATENMGAKRRLASGFTWVFDNEERAIMLEHDCLPHSTFFPFCEELLERYKDDDRIMHIGGDNFFAAFGLQEQCQDSYFYARIPHVWGWASWRRAWRYYDPEVRQWPEMRSRRVLYDIFRDPAVAYRWEQRFDDYWQDRIQSWDGQWTCAILSQGGLCINPSINLVSNIGFGPDALSCKDTESLLANVPAYPISFPLRHPSFMVPEERLESQTHRYVFNIKRSPLQKFKWFLKWHFPWPYTGLKRLFRRSA